MSAITTRAPSSKKRSTMPRPSPPAPPVTIATFPSSSPLITSPLGACGAGPGGPAHCSAGYPPPNARSRNLFDPVVGGGAHVVTGEDRVDLGEIVGADFPTD